MPDGQNATSLWRTAGFTSVWHFTDNVTIGDSADNNPLECNGCGSAPVISTYLGKGINDTSFTPDDGLSFKNAGPSIAAFGTGNHNYTMTFIGAINNFTESGYRYLYRIGTNVNNQAAWIDAYGGGTPWYVDNYGGGIFLSPGPTKGNWYYVAAKYNGSARFITVNSTTNSSAYSSLNFGSLDFLDFGTSTSGIYTEARLTNISRSGDWVTAEYAQTDYIGDEQGATILNFVSTTPPNGTSNFTYGMTFNFTSSDAIGNFSYIEVDGVNKTCIMPAGNLSCYYTLPYSEHHFNNTYDLKIYANISGDYETNTTPYSFTYYGCGEVYENGTMQGNISFGTGDPSAYGCINVSSDDITFDCGNYLIDTMAAGLDGIYAYGTANTTIQNCEINSSYNGITLDSVVGYNDIENVNISASTDGIFASGDYYSSNLSLYDVDMDILGDEGLEAIGFGYAAVEWTLINGSDGNGLDISDTVLAQIILSATENTTYGLFLEGNTHSDVSYFTATDADPALIWADSPLNISYSNISNSGDDGLYTFGALNISDVEIRDTVEYGIWMDNGLAPTTLTASNITVYNASTSCIHIDAGYDAAIVDSTIFNCTIDGIIYDGFGSLQLEDTRIFNTSTIGIGISGFAGPTFVNFTNVTFDRPQGNWTDYTSIDLTDWLDMEGYNLNWTYYSGGLCFQESANTSDQTGLDGDCSLSYSGTYAKSGIWAFADTSNLTDGNYSTFSTAMLLQTAIHYANYSKPAGDVLEGTMWTVKISSTTYNITLPAECLDSIQLKASVTAAVGNPYTNLSCYGTSDWVELFSIAGGGKGRLYEEAVYWNVSSVNKTPAGFSIFSGKLINMTSTGPSYSVIEDITFTWDDSELGASDEADFNLFKYNESGWLMLNGTPDTAGNTLRMMDLEVGSDYGILEGNYTAWWVPPTPPNGTSNSTFGLIFNYSTDTAMGVDFSYMEIDGVNHSCTVDPGDMKSCWYILTYDEHIYNHTYQVRGFADIGGTYVETNEMRVVPYFGCGNITSSDVLAGNVTINDVNWPYCFTFDTSHADFGCQGYEVESVWAASFNLNDKQNLTIHDCVLEDIGTTMDNSFNITASGANITIRNTTFTNFTIISVETSNNTAVIDSTAQEAFLIYSFGNNHNLTIHNVSNVLIDYAQTVDLGGWMNITDSDINYGIWSTGAGTFINISINDTSMENFDFAAYADSQRVTLDATNVTIRDSPIGLELFSDDWDANPSYHKRVDGARFINISGLLYNATGISGSASILELRNMLIDPDGDLSNYTNISQALYLGDFMSAGRCSMNRSTGLAVPSGSTLIGQMLNFSCGGTEATELNWSWTDAQIAGYDENLFGIYRYNGAAWVAQNTTPDIANNRMQLTYADPWTAGPYALLEAETYIIPAIQRPQNTTYKTPIVPVNISCSGPYAGYLINTTLDGTTNATDIPVLNNTYNYSTISVQDGGHNLSITCWNGTTANTSGAVYFTVDATAPNITYVSYTDTHGTTRYTSTTSWVAVNITANDSVELASIWTTIYRNGVLFDTQTSGTSPLTQNWTGLTPAVYTFNSSALDTAGNRANLSSRTVTIVLVSSPVINILTPGATSSGYTVTAACTGAFATYDFELFIDGTLEDTDTCADGAVCTLSYASPHDCNATTAIVSCTDAIFQQNNATRTFTQIPDYSSMLPPNGIIITNSTVQDFNMTWTCTPASTDITFTNPAGTYPMGCAGTFCNYTGSTWVPGYHIWNIRTGLTSGGYVYSPSYNFMVPMPSWNSSANFTITGNYTFTEFTTYVEDFYTDYALYFLGILAYALSWLVTQRYPQTMIGGGLGMLVIYFLTGNVTALVMSIVSVVSGLVYKYVVG